MYMLNLIRSKNNFYKFILLVLSLFLISCTKSSERTLCNGAEVINRFFEDEDDSIFYKYRNSKIEFNDLFKNGIRCYSADRVKNKYSTKKNPSSYLYFYVNDADYSRGMLALLLDVYEKGELVERNVKNENRVMILRDFKRIPGISSARIEAKNVCYGDPIITHGSKSYKSDDNIYGIYEPLFDSSYQEEINPKYLLYVSEDELKLEESKDDKYFIFVPFGL